MIDFQRLAKTVEKFTTDNSPAILTAIGVTGTITTAYLSSRASLRAAKVLEDELYHKNINRLAGEPRTPLENKEKLKLIWKLYMPAFGVGSMTVAAIIFANRIGTRRTAAMAAAYSISEKALVEYKDKVVEKIGEKEEKKVRDEIAKDRVNRTSPENREVIVATGGDMLCLDTASMRYFTSDYETLRSAQNDINAQILHSDSATVTDFYNLIKLEPTALSSDLGWNTDKLLELHFSSALHEKDNRPVLVVDFATVPIRNPWQYC